MIRCSMFVAMIALAVGLWTPIVLAAAPDGQEDICTRPAVFFCENFEARALRSGDFNRAIYKNNGWSLSTGALQTVVSTEHFAGSKAIRMVTPANQVSGG